MFRNDLKKLQDLTGERYFVLFIADFQPYYPHFKYAQPNRGKKNPDRTELTKIFEGYETDVRSVGVIGEYFDGDQRIEVTLEVWAYRIENNPHSVPSR
jgi:hypothetical protein